MNIMPGLKLIQAVDSTKIKVTINEKLSKLTLSSNKKKNAVAENFQQTNDPGEVEKRKSASRNLMNELSDVADEDSNKDEHFIFQNAILRSSSFKENKLMQHTETLSQIHDVKIEELSATAESMERLEMSEDFTNQRCENEIEDLMQKVSTLSVDVDSTKLRQKNAQLSSSIIEILSSSEDENINQDADEESVIFVSDSSIDSIVNDPYNDYNFMVVSDVLTSAETSVPQLPCTLSNDRADRIEAFLHDVSQEQRNMQATGRLPDDSVLVHLRPSIESVPKESTAFFESVKAKLLATADTESMSPTETESNSADKKSEKIVISPKQRNMAFDDTEVMSESVRESILPHEKIVTSTSNNVNLEAADAIAMRLANDETEANTTLNSFQKSYQSDIHALEDSVTIPETSSENMDSSHNASDEKQQDVVPSEEPLSSTLRHNTAENSQVQLSMGSINISAKINIKLQITAQYSSSNEDSDGSNENERNNSSNVNEESETDDEEVEEISNKSTNNDDTPDKDVKYTQLKVKTHKRISISQDQKSNAESLTTIAAISSEEIEKEIVDDTQNFMSNAQKLLTELYGNSWQTPEVIRSLRRTSAETQNKTKLSFENYKNTTKITTQIELDTTGQQKSVEESALGDFSIFRQNIQSNLDSTRLITPKIKAPRKLLSNGGFTEPKRASKKVSNKEFKPPQTEFKKKVIKNPSRTKRVTNERWRKVIDNHSDSDPNNITDDVDVDQTVVTDDSDEEISDASDSSWRKSAEEISSDESDYEIQKKNTTKSKKPSKGNGQDEKVSSKDRLIYLDLSKDEVTILGDTPTKSPPANKDEHFKKRLSQILSSCRYEDKPKLVATPTTTGKSKRRLFTVSYNDELEDESILAICRGETPKKKSEDIADDENLENVRFNGVAIPTSFNIYNKPLEALKTGKPVFKITPTRGKMIGTPIASREEATPFKSKEQHVYQTPSTKDKHKLEEISLTPSFKYSFLKSLDVCVGKSLCHPDALVFRENYRQKKEDLSKILYELYNSKLFGNNLNVPISWNKKLSNTAGRCLNKKRLGQRLSVVELSDKVLTSADRLRCTLIHELCHAATWIFDGEGGHGAKWKEWARKANAVFPDLPKIGVCHQYDIEYKYTYKCTLCAAKSFYHSKSKKVENIRCSYCYGAIEIFLNKKDKEGNIMPTPVREPTGFAKFVKEKYHQYKRPDMKHAEIMKLLSNEFAALKVAGNAK